MKLSELHTGEIGIIVKVAGHGGFRKRIVEMGFIKGKRVKVVLNAPLRDPIEYEIMGYKISLRREEARLVEVVSESEAKDDERLHPPTPSSPALRRQRHRHRFQRTTRAAHESTGRGQAPRHQRCPRR